MKTKILISLLVFFNTISAIDYINKYFPEDSIIRKKHNTEKRGTGWLGFDSRVRRACDKLNSTYAEVVVGLGSTDAHLHLAWDARTILADQDEAVTQKEFEWIFGIQKHLEKKRAEEAKAKDERERRKVAIARALEQREKSNLV